MPRLCASIEVAPDGVALDQRGRHTLATNGDFHRVRECGEAERVIAARGELEDAERRVAPAQFPRRTGELAEFLAVDEEFQVSDRRRAGALGDRFDVDGGRAREGGALERCGEIHAAGRGAVADQLQIEAGVRAGGAVVQLDGDQVRAANQS